MGKDSFYAKYFKRFLDVFFSLFALIVLFVPLLIVSIMVLSDVGSPVFFKQKRVGKNNKEFSLYKFRSMNNKRDANGIYLPDEQRITKLGNLIRKTSIDELPSLLNIIKGDMSIIGPRPLPVRYLSRYTEEQKKRHDVKPGLSSPSTNSGRNSQTWEKQFEGDIWYTEHVSFGLDVKSVFETIKVVLKRDGAVSEDGGARGEFIGTASISDLQTDSEGNYMKFEKSNS